MSRRRAPGGLTVEVRQFDGDDPAGAANGVRLWAESVVRQQFAGGSETAAGDKLREPEGC